MPRHRSIIRHGGVVVGNVYDKYGTGNPVARRLVNEFLAAFDRCVEESGASSALDVGCGAGELALRLARGGIRTRGFDISPDLVARAARSAKLAGLAAEFTVNDIYEFDPAAHASDLVVCSEVLEHLAEPELALQRLAQAARPHVLLSVPREPVWRLLNLARLSYVPALGNTPGHVQHWSRGRFLSLVRRHLVPVRIESPFPWTMVLARAQSSEHAEAMG